MRNPLVERERKYSLGEHDTLPRLEQIRGVTEVSDPGRDKLEAVYFDSEDLRLARAGVTLRRREGGSDAGWHLKVPAGPDTRSEFHAHLGEEPDQPPGELTDLVTGILRGAKPRPVARISTNRRRRKLLGRHGDVLAEVTDDRVSGQPTTGRSDATTWREVEVELAEHTGAELLDRFEDLLRRSGLHRSAASSKLQRVLDVDVDHPSVGRKSTAGEVVLGYLREQIEAIGRQDILVRSGADDAVHQLRVAARRLRSALRVFGKIVDRAGTRGIERELRWLAGKLGPARDLEVLEQRCRSAVAELPDELVLGEVNTRLTRHFAPARAAAERVAVRTLNERRYLRLRDQLDQLLAAPPLTERAGRRARKELPRHVGRAYRKVARRIDTMHDTPPGPDRDTATHSVRKAAKRLRYATECVIPAVGKPARRTSKRAKALTKVLGDFQDSVVARPVLRQLGVAAHVAGDNGFTFGLLFGQERAEAKHIDSKIDSPWPRK